jgi:hypothetical protein
MRYTNDHNIPKAMFNAATHESYVLKGDISASSLGKSVQQVQLLKRFDDQIVVDASTRLWAMLGRAMHNLVEDHSPDEFVTEQTLKTTVLDWVVCGTPDVWIPATKAIEDYKVTAVAAMSRAKEEWVAQLNTYRWLIAKELGIKTKSMTIHAMLRDYNMWELFKNKDYPLIPFQSREIEELSLGQVEAAVHVHVLRHQKGEGYNDKDIPRCNDNDLWKDPPTFAVKKVGGSRAINGGVCDTAEQAEALAYMKEKEGKAKYFVEHRPSMAKRCHYCDARCICEQYKELVADGEIQKRPEGVS